MTAKEIDLVIKMLEAYSDYHLGPAGCNDTPDEWLAPFTEKEMDSMNRDFEALNGSPQDYESGGGPLPDFCYVALMRHKLKGLKEVA